MVSLPGQRCGEGARAAGWGLEWGDPQGGTKALSGPQIPHLHPVCLEKGFLKVGVGMSWVPLGQGFIHPIP